VKRWAGWFLVLVTAIAGFVALMVLTDTRNGLTDPRAAGITKENFARIEEGMSADEVSQLFGVPPGDYREGGGFVLVGPSHIPRPQKATRGRLEIWYIPHYHVEVLFDGEGRVVGKHWHDPHAPSP
jgi:hypothetical protein